MDKMNLMLNRAVHLGREEDDDMETRAFVDSSAYYEMPEEEATLDEDYDGRHGGIYQQGQPSSVVI
jgi:hypothetical protein